MVIQAKAGLWEKSPDVLPVPSNLLDHARIVENGFANQTGQVGTSVNCSRGTLLPAECGTVFGSEDGQVEKVFNGFSDVTGYIGMHQDGLICNAIGFDLDEAGAEVERLADLTESRSIERRLQQAWVANAAEIDLVAEGEARAMLAALEGTFTQSYAGLPTIHLHPVVAAYLAARKSIESQAGKFYTRLGSKVVVGVGYGTLAGATAGTFPMYASGEVAVGRGKQILPDPQLNRTNNEVIALAERPFIVATDCDLVMTANTSIWGA